MLVLHLHPPDSLPTRQPQMAMQRPRQLPTLPKITDPWIMHLLLAKKLLSLREMRPARLCQLILGMRCEPKCLLLKQVFMQPILIHA